MRDLMASATGAAGAGLKIVLCRQPSQLECLGHVLVDRFLHLLHLLARIEKTLRNRISQERLAAILKLRDLLVRQGKALLLLELENLSLFTQELVLGLGFVIAHKSGYLLTNRLKFRLIEDDLAKFPGLLDDGIGFSDRLHLI